MGHLDTETHKEGRQCEDTQGEDGHVPGGTCLPAKVRQEFQGGRDCSSFRCCAQCSDHIPGPCLGTSLMASHRRIRSTGGYDLVRLQAVCQAGPEKPSMMVSVASVSPRTKAPCELAEQTQAPLSGRGLGEAQSQPGPSHLATWAFPRDAVTGAFLLSRALHSS